MDACLLSQRIYTLNLSLPSSVKNGDYLFSPLGPLAPGLLPNWNCSVKLRPSSSWLEVSSPGFVIDSTICSASTICCSTSFLLDSHSIPPMNISNSIMRDLWREKTRSSSQTIR